MLACSAWTCFFVERNTAATHSTRRMLDAGPHMHVLSRRMELWGVQHIPSVRLDIGRPYVPPLPPLCPSVEPVWLTMKWRPGKTSGTVVSNGRCRMELAGYSKTAQDFTLETQWSSVGPPCSVGMTSSVLIPS